jgi:hypothetical protein
MKYGTDTTKLQLTNNDEFPMSNRKYFCMQPNPSPTSRPAGIRNFRRQIRRPTRTYPQPAFKLLSTPSTSCALHVPFPFLLNHLFDFLAHLFSPNMLLTNIFISGVYPHEHPSQGYLISTLARKGTSQNR